MLWKVERLANGDFAVETEDEGEAFAEFVGGRFHRATQRWRLSPAKLRDAEALIDAGFIATTWYGGFPPDVTNPDTGEVFEDRFEAIATIDRPNQRCRRTLEMAL